MRVQIVVVLPSLGQRTTAMRRNDSTEKNRRGDGERESPVGLDEREFVPISGRTSAICDRPDRSCAHRLLRGSGLFDARETGC